MPTNDTPCSDCKYFEEVYSPQPGESWNRCSHLDRRLDCNPKYICKANVYGFAFNKCNYYKIKLVTKITNSLMQRIKLCLR